MEPIIHNAINQALMHQPPRRLDDHLWVSDLGKNPYAMARRLMLKELEAFDYPTMLKMDGGSAIEDYSSKQLADNLGYTLITQFPLFNEAWAGYADWVIGHHEGEGKVIIADHKASCGKWWDYKESLPRAADCLQVWKYGDLYRAEYGILPELRLYYRGWGAWGEFQIIEGAGGLRAVGHITDEKGAEVHSVNRTRFVSPKLLSEELEAIRLRILSYGMTMEELEEMEPDGPDWDYAERRTSELLGIE